MKTKLIIKKLTVREKLRRFYEENGSVLLPKEIVLKDRLDANSRHELLLYRLVATGVLPDS